MLGWQAAATRGEGKEVGGVCKYDGLGLGNGYKTRILHNGHCRSLVFI